MRKYIFALIVLLIVIQPLICSADPQEFIVERSYILGYNETMASAQKHMIAEAQRLALEQAGILIESYSQLTSHQLTKDEVNTIAAGVVKTTILEQRQEVIGENTIQLYAKVRCLVDPDSAEIVRKRIEDFTYKDKLIQSMRDVAKLRLRLYNDLVLEARSHNYSIQQMVSCKITLDGYKQIEKYVPHVMKGEQYLNAQDYDDAFVEFNTALTIAADYPPVEAFRGLVACYIEKRLYQDALSILREALAYHPEDKELIKLRGIASRHQYDND